MAGPLVGIDDVDAIKDRLKAAAAGGHRNRVGLQPCRTSGLWQFDPQCRNVAVTRSEAAVGDDPAAILEAFSVGTRQHHPLRIDSVGDYLMVEFDHGLGDARFVAEILALASGDANGYAVPAPLVNCDSPIRTAVRHALRTAPWPFIKSALAPLEDLSTPTVVGALTESASILYTRTPEGFLDTIRDIRDARHPGVAVLPFIVVALANSLRSYGIDSDDYVDVLVDLRRYLPKGVGTLSNFATVVPVKSSNPGVALEFAASLNSYTTGGRSLTRHIAASLWGATRPIVPSWRRLRTDSPTARLVITDITAHDEMGKVNWIPQRPRVLLCKMPVTASHQITFAVARIGSQVHLTATYYESHFAAEPLRLALKEFPERMLDVMASGEAGPSLAAGSGRRCTRPKGLTGDPRKVGRSSKARP